MNKSNRRFAPGGKVLKKLLLHAVIITFALVISLPFLWMVASSLKQEYEVFNMGGGFWNRFWPQSAQFRNYITALEFADRQLLKGFFNTMLIAIPVVLIGITSSCLGAYGFSKIRFPGRDKIFFLLICTMMIPGIVTMVPSFIIFKNLNWLDSYKPLMIPPMFGSVLGVFFLRQFFMGIPDELLESAEIDGAGELRKFFQIVLPCGKTAITTQMVLGFMACYNDFIGPLIYINSPERFTLQLALANAQGFYYTSWPLVMSAAVLALIPTIIIFMFAQNSFISGIATTGLKV
jgi:multiple sugar transport system permease protein